MTVDIKFRRDDLALRDVLPNDDEALFHDTLLIVQVSIKVGARDIFAQPGSDLGGRPWIVGPEDGSPWLEVAVEDGEWAPQPIIGFLSALKRALRTVATGQPAVAHLELGWPPLHLEPVREAMLSIRLEHGEPATAPAGEFHAAVEDLAEAIQTWIREAAPQLMNHPAWKDWFEPAA